jgi:hypothetical protein
MNCLEARREFASFWRRSMKADDRAAFVSHLGGCARCDQSFRLFALTAPVLHSDADAARARLHPEGSARVRAVPLPLPLARGEKTPWRLVSAGLAMAAAAALALYISSPPKVTLEDAIGEGNTGVEVTTYNPANNLFGQDVFGPDSTAPDVDQGDSGRGFKNGLAG